MTKELVEEAKGRPKEDETVINKAKTLFESIKRHNNSIKHYEKEIVKCNEYLKEYAIELDLLKQGKYKIQKEDYTKTGFSIIFEKKEE